MMVWEATRQLYGLDSIAFFVIIQFLTLPPIIPVLYAI